MADQLLKTVRITDNIKVEVYQQGKKRKYALFYDSNETKTEKYDVALTDDQVINEALIFYNGKFSKSYKVIQDPYKDPLPVRTYGGGTASPYYLNNGCKLNILWVGQVPNPAFTLGTYSNPWLADQDENSTIDRYLMDQVITSSSEDVLKTELLPKSSWVISGTFSRLGRVYGPDYRDVTKVNHKVLTIVPPESSKEDYFVWSNHGLVYSKDILPAGTQREVTVLVNGRPQTGYTVGNFSENFSSDWEDSQILGKVLMDYKEKVEKLHGIPSPDYKLALCSPDTGSCSVIEYKSPLKKPDDSKIIADQIPTGLTPSAVPKVKFTIDGLPDEILVNAKTNLPEFKIWAGSIPKTKDKNGDSYDDFEDGIGDEYVEGSFSAEEEEAVKIEGNAPLDQQAKQYSKVLESTPYVPSGKHELDLIPGSYVNNNGDKIQLCCIDGKPINVRVADALLDMMEAAKKDGIKPGISISSGFRSPYDSINTKSSKGFTVTASSQKYLYDGYKAGKSGFNRAAAPGSSNHGNGIGFDLNTGSLNKNSLNKELYVWLVKNSWKFGFVRAVFDEEWHFDYLPDLINSKQVGKPYAKLAGTEENRFYSKLGLTGLT
jgi:LAS superfamily LD-carboxypeptidase LdcB